MRIRSIKPEYWRSDDITGLPISTRLTFIGLWSYVDDNGVGADKLISIVADLYADDFSRDPQETVKRVTEDMQRLASGGQVTRYQGLHNGSTKDLLYISKWKQHQKVNHPSLGHKYPLPPAELLNCATGLTPPSSDPLETLTHEQGNRGTAERGNGGAGDEDPPPEPPEDYDEYIEAVVVVPEYVEASTQKSKRYPSSGAKAVVRQILGNAGYPNTILTRLAVQAEKLYTEGHPDALIRESLIAWDQRPNVLPEWLPTILGDVVKDQRAGPSASVTAFDRKKSHNAAIFEALADEPHNPELLA